MRKFHISSVCSAFNPSTIGTKVTNQSSFLANLNDALESYDSSNDRVEGQHFVNLDNSIDFVTSGVGKLQGRTINDFILREHRGEVSKYLKREFAEKCDALNVVVYSKDAYINDPQVSDASEVGDATHVVVAVLGAAGPRSPLSPARLVANLAGGNNEVETWTIETAKEKARESVEYFSNWSVVAD